MQHWNFRLPLWLTVRGRFLRRNEIVRLERLRPALRSHVWNVGQLVEQRDQAATELRDLGEGVDFPALVGGDEILADLHVGRPRKAPRPDRTEVGQLGDELIELDATGAIAGAGAKDRIERIAVAGVQYVHDDIVIHLHRTGHDRGIAAGRGDRGRADRIGRDVCGRDAIGCHTPREKQGTE
jgi:hypothetical protein